MTTHLNGFPHNTYEAAQFTVTHPATDYNVKTAESMFTKTYEYVRIYTTAKIEVNFNDTTNDPITIPAGTGRSWEGLLQVSNIFITTTGANAVVDIELI